jgi:hypothetical protein
MCSRMGDDNHSNKAEENLWEAFGSESSESENEGSNIGTAEATETATPTGNNRTSSQLILDGNYANFEVFEQNKNHHGGGGGPSRGKGLRSLKSFACGDEILRERATICVANEHAATSLLEAQILHAHSVQQAYDALSLLEQRAVMSLSNCGKYYCDNNSNGSTDTSPIIDQKLQGIFHTNSYRLSGIDGIQKYSGLFLTTARINHSCRPNVSHCWRPDLQLFLIFACRSIAEGDELVSSYLPIMLVGDGYSSSNSGDGNGDMMVHDTKGRREFLRQKFAFHCICEMCRESNKEGADDQMTRIAHLLDKTIPDLVTFRQYTKAIKAIDTSLSLLQQQGFTGGIYTRSLFQHGYQIATSSCNPLLAMSYLERQLVAVTESNGIGCPEAIRIQQLISRSQLI